MPRILAIEADSTRRTLLGSLVREHVNAELTIADSVRSAIAEIDRRLPDVILTPALLSPAEGADLMTQIQRRDARYVQLLAIPALGMLSEPSLDDRRVFGVFKRRSEPASLLYDRAMVGAQIADAVARAHQARVEYACSLAQQAEREELAKWHLARKSEESEALVHVSAVVRHQIAEERRTALRLPQQAVPWLSSARLACDTQISLVNISSSGVLIESGSKFIPGSTTELHLSGPERNLVVPVRFIRSEIASIDRVGVKYHAAAAFGREIDLAASRPGTARPSSPPRALAELLSAALADSRAVEPAHVRFTRGLRDLVGARDVQIRSGAGSSGREALYFDVPGDDRARTTLQVLFERGRDVTPEEFRLLKAAAWLTAAALEFDKSPATVREQSKPVALLEECVA